MKILLLGEYSNVHNTLAAGLRSLGHVVTVASNGDFWKDYPRDIDLARGDGFWNGVSFLGKVAAALPRLTGYDIVQIVNPLFLELKAERLTHIYKFIKKHNKRIVLGGFGMDYYWVSTCVEEKPLRYSDFNIGSQLRTNVEALAERKDWIGTAKERLNRTIANDCDAIVTCLYEYWRCYQPHFPDKTSFIPLPMALPDEPKIEKHERLRLFIGINKSRSAYKGTDLMLRAAQRALKDYPDRIELLVAESVPFSEYQKMMDGSDAILDQLYSYTPSMNSLLAMSKGIIVIGGGEPENYEIIGEKELRPIVNVTPSVESVYQAIVSLATAPALVTRLRQESRQYVLRHHEQTKVARQYEELYNSIL